MYCEYITGVDKTQRRLTHISFGRHNDLRSWTVLKDLFCDFIL